MNIVDILLCIFLPPIAVLLRKGAGKDFLINLLLLILLPFIGGIIHAFYVLANNKSSAA